MTCCNTRTGQERLSAEGTTRISVFLDAGTNYVCTAKHTQNCACTRFVLKLILVTTQAIALRRLYA
jgi:hypothetical protein